MLRITAMFFAICLVITGCGKKAAPVPEPILHLPMADLVDTLVSEYAMPMPAAMDDELMESMLGLESDEIKSYCGYFSMDADCPNQIIAVEAADGCAESTAKALERRREFLLEAYDGQPEQRSRVETGCVIFHSNWVFMVIGGRQGFDTAAEVSEMTKKIEDNFKK